MSCSFTNKVLGHLHSLTSWKDSKGYKNDVYFLPIELDEKVACLNPSVLGAVLTRLSKEQAYYIGVSVDGPRKPKTYRH